MAQQSNIAPGYCIVQQPGTLDFQARMLFTNVNSDAARYFMQLNKDTPWLKPGQILIVADPNNSNQTYQLNSLFEAKKKVNSAMATTDSSVASFLNDNYENIAALTALGDKVFGNAGDVGEKYFKQIESILKKIELTYQNQYRTQGVLFGQQFYAERRALFGQLDMILNQISRKTLGLKEYSDIKKALNLSTKSIIHEWSTVGVGAIPGYSNYIGKASKAASFMKAGGWVALGFSFANTSNDVYHACTVDREYECRKVAVKEYSKFGGGAAGAYFASLGTGAICIAIGASTAGVGGVACGIIVGLSTSSAGALLGTAIGGRIGDAINEI
ncbi:hypothetical protein RI820_001538 [Pluralibacter gergoviae]|nr:hypothetical protein [Pluralibacter gergoviae]ELC3019157.1 hypothetical protein [Pluralibacter gergoviae]ELC3021641.1 hypothetical protein [Pluralibacter gergoviae]